MRDDELVFTSSTNRATVIVRCRLQRMWTWSSTAPMINDGHWMFRRIPTMYPVMIPRSSGVRRKGSRCFVLNTR